MNCDKQDFCSKVIAKYLQDCADEKENEEDNAVNLLWSFNQWILKQQNNRVQELLNEKEQTTTKVHRLVDALTRLHQTIEEKDQELLMYKNQIEFLENQLESNNNTNHFGNHMINLQVFTKGDCVPLQPQGFKGSFAPFITSSF